MERLTIDEAITHAREVALEQSSIATELSLTGTDASEYIKCKQEHEQLAEWLEELKELRNMTASHLYAVAFNRGYLKAEKEVRNKVLDDFVKFASDMPTVEEEDGTIRPMWLEEIAEQLKVGE